MGLVALAPSAVQAQGNILLIIADDFGADSHGLYGVGSSTAPTPTINSLATDGVQFLRAWSNPVCSPTRATILTGRYGFRTGVGNPAGNNQIGLNEFTLPQALSQLGYSTACIGKWHLGGNSNGGGDNPNLMGFDHYSGSLANITDYFNWTKTVNGTDYAATNYATSENVDDAMAWISQQGASPWFCWLAFNSGHSPFHKPPSDLHSYDSLSGAAEDINSNPVPYYQAMIESMDTEIGRLLSSMDPTVLANTDIIFIGDNGTPGKVAVSPANSKRVKGTLYQGGVWVPWIVSGPSVTGLNRTSSSLINTADIFATVIEMAGGVVDDLVPAMVSHDSVSILPLLDDPGLNAVRNYVVAERFRFPTADSDGKTIRNEEFKLIRFDSGTEQFYDLLADSTEATDLLNGTLTANEQANYDSLSAELDLLVNGDPNWIAITYDDFEDGFGNFTDGGDDCNLYTRGKHASQGKNAANIQDDSGTASSFAHTEGHDVTGYTDLRVDFSFKMTSMETGESFSLQYFDGLDWQTIATMASGDFDNGVIHDATVPLDNQSYAFPTNAMLRFVCEASNDKDDVYIDEVVFWGYLSQ